MQNKILWFTAAWCQPCQQMKKALEGEDLKGLKAYDVDEYPATAQAYNVKSVPTFVRIDENGKELSRLNGSLPKAMFLSWYNE